MSSLLSPIKVTLVPPKDKQVECCCLCGNPLSPLYKDIPSVHIADGHVIDPSLIADPGPDQGWQAIDPYCINEHKLEQYVVQF